MKNVLKSLSFIMVGVLMFGLVGCGNSAKKKNNSVPTSTTVTEDKTKNKDNDKTADKPKDAKVVLKDVPVEGKLTDEEKSKIVDLTEKSAREAINGDYTTDTVESMSKFFNYTTEDVKNKLCVDNRQQKLLDSLKKTKQIVKVENITYNKINSTSDGIIVDFTAKIIYKSHTNPNKNGKEAEVKCRFWYNKDFKIVGLDISDY